MGFLRKFLGRSSADRLHGYNDLPESIVAVEATPATRRAICRLQAARVLPTAETLPRRTAVVPRDLPSGHTEAEGVARGRALRNTERSAPIAPDFPVGTFRADLDGVDEDVAELRLVSIAALQQTERPGRFTVEKYVDWARRGSMIPPIRVLETGHGDLRVTDGHHRIAAVQALGRRTIKAWVTMTVAVLEPNSKVPILRGVTQAQAPRLVEHVCKR